MGDGASSGRMTYFPIGSPRTSKDENEGLAI